jgi:type I restriction enzyme, S subunit
VAKEGKSTAVPRLRFPEFQSWQAWEYGEASNILTVLQGYGFPERHQGMLSGRYPFYKVSDISSCLDKGSHLLRDAANYISDETVQALRAKLIPIGTTIFAKIGEAIRSNKRAMTTQPCLIDNNVAGVKAIAGRASDSFVFYLWSTVLLDKLAGGVVPSINKSTLEGVQVQWPGPREQQKVADCLTSLDELIAAQGRKVEALKTHKHGLMQQLFPREGETLPALRFPEFRAGPDWMLRRIGDVLEDVSRSIDMDDHIQYSLVTVKRRYGGVISRERLKGRAIKVKSQFVVRAGDFLISKRQIVHNACGIVPSELDGSIVSNEYSVLGPKSGCDIEFFNYFSQQPAVSVSFLNSSVGIVIEKMLFKLDTWLKHEFLFPSIDEQRRIAALLASVEKKLQAESDKLDALKSHKKGLMQQLFPSLEEV